MSATASFRQQHDELVALVQKIAGQLDATALSSDASGVRRDLSALAGKISIHLAMEDNALYPKMLNSGDAQAADAANKFKNEMGDLAGAFQAFNSKWMSPSTIQSDPQTFINEVSGIAKALGDRIQRENTQLYPLADQL